MAAADRLGVEAPLADDKASEADALPIGRALEALVAANAPQMGRGKWIYDWLVDRVWPEADLLALMLDWEAKPVSTVRLHWPVCEGIQATASLRALTGDDEWEQWYRRLWDHAAAYFVDDTGSWVNELDEDFREGSAVWPGRPDVYHAAGAYLAPLLPVWPFLTVAARDHGLRIG